jgi:hypothetical protein
MLKLKWIAAVMLVAGLVVSFAKAADAPAVTIELNGRQASASPTRIGFTHTGGGNIDVQQPAADTIVVTMSGTAVAGAHPGTHSTAVLNFELEQCFDVVIADPKKTKSAKISLEARLIGLLRSHCKGGGSAGIGCPAEASVLAGDVSLVSVALPGRAVAAGNNLSVNDHHGPVTGTITAGKFTLHQRFGIQASHPKSIFPCKTASAEFGDGSLDPLWISAWEPFKGASKKDFGLQVTLKVAAE